MTDSDEPDPPRAPHSGDGFGPIEPRGRADGKDDEDVMRWADHPAHVAPTYPEVPSAKRRGAFRRQRSLVGLGAVILGLLSMTLIMLYRASLRVGTRQTDEGPPQNEERGSRIPHSPVDVAEESTWTNLATPTPTPFGAELGDKPPAAGDEPPSGSASATPRSSPPALDIIRTPAF